MCLLIAAVLAAVLCSRCLVHGQTEQTSCLNLHTRTQSEVVLHYRATS